MVHWPARDPESFKSRPHFTTIGQKTATVPLSISLYIYKDVLYIYCSCPPAQQSLHYVAMLQWHLNCIFLVLMLTHLVVR